ncbi:DNA helicase/exodeoxyribonuclease V subunit A [Breoghania corrubedonensis]|uniref:DNA 3'-5' helicase n=1 Tax=Breoghania corrubedonensis TaxID=665038 RepID=A0A2T5VG68_9HYPH|nr:double-strand break repair helicase AddA [Breoghania corrubedonensis]PTW62752.1 DNA helicase/exodeoxyribonuclease V subunit A [Breoghania corrubedonensis]
MEIPAVTLERQRNASHPEASAWVSANAGAGKTFVLARRVVRLLLNGTNPSRLLCLTFTKAAAAEMASRVFDTLATWVSLDDEALVAAITDMGEPEPGADKLARARRLFATALETPGGLKIQTIHAFCESLLHQFPLEANVAGHFTVLDERVQDELLAEARARVLHQAAEDEDGPLGRALASLIALMSDGKVADVVDAVIAKRDDLRRWIVEAGTLEDGLVALSAAFGIAPGETVAACDAEILNGGIEPERRKAIAEALRTGAKTDLAKAEALDASISASSEEERRRAYLSAFLTKKGEPLKTSATKAIQQAFPEVVSRLTDEAARLVALFERRRAIVTMEGTGALMRLADAVLQHYERDKRQRGLLDFEDLVVKTANLLSAREAAAWVQYKLDQGLDHILVDEAQDTSPRQWQVISALAEEFFAGAGARSVTRTLFAVGDEKQSIYSFQGAVPAYFAEMRRYFQRRASEGGGLFHDVRLTLSFRSTADVLGAVDLVFADEAVRKGLSRDGEAPVHEAVRRNDPGLVEIWPMAWEEKTEPPDDWQRPLDHAGPGSPMIRVAERIAATVAGWQHEGTANAGDVLVLVRKRGAFVAALNRALKVAGVAVAGADRLTLSEHIAVQDLVALGRFVLLAEDDLSLAALLKSPLFGFGDDDLFQIAYERGERTLWQALRARADGKNIWKGALTTLEDWRARADFVPPYEFYARILGADGGRRRMRERLGQEVDDVLDEFLNLALDYERTGVPGLEGFLAWLTAAPTQIKREMEGAGGAVRIMTVHGAKGLEAPIVFLVDSGGKPAHHGHDPDVLAFSLSNDPIAAPALVWKPASGDQTAWHAEAIGAVREAAEEEYRRLLYVAMTRARDRLVVCGFAGSRGPSEGCWHALVDHALSPGAQETRDAAGEVVARSWHKERPYTGDTPDDRDQTSHQEREHEERAPQATAPLPDWATRTADAYRLPRRLAPSRAVDLLAVSIEEPEPRHALAAALDPGHWGLVRGQIVHRLLQSLPDIDASERRERARSLLESALDEHFADRGDALLREVFAVLDDPAFAAVFSAGSRAEVPIVGTLVNGEGQTFAVSGQIDRLVATSRDVLIIDYKTNADPPLLLEAVSDDYVAQLAVYRMLVSRLYPDRKVRAILLWTEAPRLMEIPEDVLVSAVKGLSVMA